MNESITNACTANYSIVVPTLNGGQTWQKAAISISKQTPPPRRVLIIDSGSNDGTLKFAQLNGFTTHQISLSSFDHGGTRKLGIEANPDVEHVVFLTQDAILLSTSSVKKLLKAFDDPSVGAAYGRQVPSEVASSFERHSRAFNYPDRSVVKTRHSIPSLGIKTAFCSNSFAAYRKSALEAVGGFPDRTLFAEDMLVAAKMILKGFSIAYVAEAECEHWHEYSLAQEFRRAFDIGVFHSMERWILDEFGSARGEGGSLVISGLKQIGSEDIAALPKAILRYVAKTIGYAAGRSEKILPLSVKRFCSMNRAYWKANA